LKDGDRLGVIPGGIAEIFEGYPKAGTSPDNEYCIIRKGLFRLACKHNVPVSPVYCFGATKMFRRLEVPVLEKLSNLLRISICAFYGRWGLPVPFRQRLLYVIGQPIAPPSSSSSSSLRNNNNDKADIMYQQFCKELVRIFERHKEAYGWGNKVLKLVEK